MDETDGQFELDILELKEQEEKLDRVLELGCRQLLDEFRRRYPPIKRVPKLVLRPEILQSWMDEHTEKRQ